MQVDHWASFESENGEPAPVDLGGSTEAFKPEQGERLQMARVTESQ
ncbi:hypothetical protein [Bradyrhizobium cenepequi]|jgi:hypothetical protein